MKCSDPVLCYKDEKGKRRFKHFSLCNPFEKKYQYRDEVFSCGKCLFCRKRKAYELACRCVLHSSVYTSNCFLTLTYDEKKEGYHNEFNYPDIQKFKKRLRQHCHRHHGGKKIEIFNVHEYGKNKKKHWHLVVFNHDFLDKTLYTKKNDIPIYTSKLLESLWPYGYNTIGDVTTASAMYQAQYMEKDFRNDNITNRYRSNSKHSGLAKPYFLKNFSQLLRLGYVPINGKKLPLPRYFEKLAHKHYSHYYETENFFDTDQRKKLYTPFKEGQENLEIAKLYIDYKKQKVIKIQELEKNWEELISKHYETGEDPDFIQAGKNALYDLKNKISEEKF